MNNKDGDGDDNGDNDDDVDDDDGGDNDDDDGCRRGNGWAMSALVGGARATKAQCRSGFRSANIPPRPKTIANTIANAIGNSTRTSSTISCAWIFKLSGPEDC